MEKGEGVIEGGCRHSHVVYLKLDILGLQSSKNGGARGYQGK
jgi:hypothetical protein